MSVVRAQQRITDGRAREAYRRLMDHCMQCPECRAIPEKACGTADGLRSAWSAARKEARR